VGQGARYHTGWIMSHPAPQAPLAPPDAAGWTLAAGLSVSLHVAVAALLALGLSRATGAVPGPETEITLRSVPLISSGGTDEAARIAATLPEDRLRAATEPELPEAKTPLDAMAALAPEARPELEADRPAAEAAQAARALPPETALRAAPEHPSTTPDARVAPEATLPEAAAVPTPAETTRPAEAATRLSVQPSVAQTRQTTDTPTRLAAEPTRPADTPARPDPADAPTRLTAEPTRPATPTAPARVGPVAERPATQSDAARLTPEEPAATRQAQESGPEAPPASAGADGSGTTPTRQRAAPGGAQTARVASPQEALRMAMQPPAEDTLERALRDRPSTFLSDRRAAPRPGAEDDAPQTPDAALQAAIRAHLGGLPDIPCFAALPALDPEGSLRMEALGPAEGGLQAFRAGLEAETGPVAGMAVQTVSQGQCATLDFVRRSRGYPEHGLSITLNTRRIESGGRLEGAIHQDASRDVALLLVDTAGRVQSLDRFLTREADRAGFAIQMGLQGPAVETWQLLLAIATDQPLQSLAGLSGPQEPAEVFARLRAEIATRGLSPEIGLVAFSLN